MKKIEVLGIGCPNCKKTEALIRKHLDSIGWKEDENFTLSKITDPSEIAARGILATPGVIIDDAIISKGKVPSKKDIQGWFE